MTLEAVKHLEAMKQALEALEPLNKDARKRALLWLAETLDVSVADQVAPSPPLKPAGSSRGSTSVTTGTTPKQFMSDKRPTSDIERITALAYYLTHERQAPYFKTTELTKLNTEAAGPKFGNAAQASANAVKNGYLTQAGKGQRQITARGEAIVRALPDREAVTAELANHPLRPRKARRKATTKESRAAK